MFSIAGLFLKATLTNRRTPKETADHDGIRSIAITFKISLNETTYSISSDNIFKWIMERIKQLLNDIFDTSTFSFFTTTHPASLLPESHHHKQGGGCVVTPEATALSLLTCHIPFKSSSHPRPGSHGDCPNHCSGQTIPPPPSSTRCMEGIHQGSLVSPGLFTFSPVVNNYPFAEGKILDKLNSC